MSPRGLGQVLRAIRAGKGKTLREVEKGTDISNAYLSQLETGKVENPSPAILSKLAEFFEVPYESLMEAAGYIRSRDSVEQKDRTKERRLSPLEYAMLGAELTDEEQELVADYIGFVRSQRQKKKSRG